MQQCLRKTFTITAVRRADIQAVLSLWTWRRTSKIFIYPHLHDMTKQAASLHPEVTHDHGAASVACISCASK